MKILKIFGLVVGIHVFALILIFANPGCSSAAKAPPAPVDTAVVNPPASAPAPMITVPPMSAGAASAPGADMNPGSTVPSGFNPDAPATYANSGGGHYAPTRPDSPAASALLAPPVTDVTPATTYKVRSGDSLWTVAKRHHLTVAQLAAANHIRPNAILREDQNLIIPAASGNPAHHATASVATRAMNRAASRHAERVSGSALTYVVKPGDTIGSIARKYGVRARDIEVENNITDPRRIRPGAKLVIPGWKATAKASNAQTPGPSSAPAPEPAAPSVAPELPPSSPGTGNVPVIKIDESPISPAPNP